MYLGKYYKNGQMNVAMYKIWKRSGNVKQKYYEKNKLA